MAEIGIILGSGLKKFAENLDSPTLLYSDENSFHKKKVCETWIGGIKSLVFSGRNHYYENPGNKKLFENVQMCLDHSVKLLIISNAAGGVNSTLKISDLMLITSFIDMINARPVEYFSHGKDSLIRRIIEIAIENKINLKRGVYYAMKGPNYESKAEIKLLRKSGADAVGMSTVPEIKFAESNGIKVIAISCITNLLRNVSGLYTSHDDVEKAADNAFENFAKLLLLLVKNHYELLK
ncbi:MAG: purine-nucleoside phosphorylase [Ignavibacteriaceae bacterium]|jgi:purine-nucleoside phosphorylase|nr:MAG: Purine nucleoside phosphorylase [Chlorobi bacterium OLB4]MBW7856273.1 purine-nucleoside phosphorylase [Ignavibacteria bacterium]MEB2329366.1 purine-nucleoside phosphorylase [Ignavibacteriaceae bacterium]OQY78872.1 MAG: hypothetical protein B6D43_00690 [Ignavibacteriales bacterium UTCHB1]